MTLIEQCALWHENNEFDRIIETIEDLSIYEITPELTCELARAYNNSGDVDRLDAFEHAISLLESVSTFYVGDYHWNFRMAYALFYLNREAEALSYFKNALYARPGDENTLTFIIQCYQLLTMPLFDVPFTQRVDLCWELFLEHEQFIREHIDAMETDEEKISVIMTKLTEVLGLIAEGLVFEVGKRDTYYEIVLVIDYQRANIYKFLRFLEGMPESLKSHWKFVIGRTENRAISIKVDNTAVCAEDVIVWLEEDYGTFSFELYCEKLSHVKNREEVHNALMFILDHTLGELNAMSVIGSIDILEEAKEEVGIKLPNLKHVLSGMNVLLDLPLEEMLEITSVDYDFDRMDFEEQEARSDVLTGTTLVPSLVNDYYSDADYSMNSLHKDGAVAGFFILPLSNFEDIKLDQALELVFDAAVLKIKDKCSHSDVTFIGTAVGASAIYLDFIGWDLDVVIEAAIEVFTSMEVSSLVFQTFRRGTQPIVLINDIPEINSDNVLRS